MTVFVRSNALNVADRMTMVNMKHWRMIKTSKRCWMFHIRLNFSAMSSIFTASVSVRCASTKIILTTSKVAIFSSFRPAEAAVALNSVMHQIRRVNTMQRRLNHRHSGLSSPNLLNVVSGAIFYSISLRTIPSNTIWARKWSILLSINDADTSCSQPFALEQGKIVPTWTFLSSGPILLRYYFAFIFAEAINNAGGLGYNGVDEKGQPRWNLLTNIKPFELETATSLKVVFDHWNMRKSTCDQIPLDAWLSVLETSLWLRRIVYYRMKKGRTLGVFVLSAIWVNVVLAAEKMCHWIDFLCSRENQRRD